MFRKFITMILFFSTLLIAVEGVVVMFLDDDNQNTSFSGDIKENSEKEINDIEDGVDEKNEKYERLEYFTELQKLKFSSLHSRNKLHSIWKQTLFSKYYKSIITPPPQHIC